MVHSKAKKRQVLGEGLTLSHRILQADYELIKIQHIQSSTVVRCVRQSLEKDVLILNLGLAVL